MNVAGIVAAMACHRNAPLFFVLVWLGSTTVLASPGDWKGALSKGVDICRVHASPGLGGAPANIRVIALPGNQRAVAFGDATDVETTVQCTLESGMDSSAPFPAGCEAWPEDKEPVGDVSMCPSCPCSQDLSGGLQSASNSMLFEVGIGPACRQAEASHPVDVLLFGMGGGAVQTYAMQKCPEHTRVESVEADPRMAAIAIKFFGVPVKAGVSVVDVDDASSAAASFAQQLNAAEAPVASLQQQSAGRGLRRSAASQGETALGKKKWDVIMTDCFIDKGVVPEGCRSREFVTYLRLLVQPGGKILHHMWHTSPYDDSVAPTFDDTVQLYKDTFGEHKVLVEPVPRQKDAQWDSVIIVRG